MNNKISGIYKIINRINKKYYVGSSININGKYGRFYQHKDLLIKNKHYNTYLQYAWNKYKEENFEFIIIENMPNATEQELLNIEQRYLDIAKLEKEKCYNLSFIAGRVDFTEEVRKKISLKGIGRPNPNKGKKMNQEFCDKISTARKGCIISEEQKRKISLSMKNNDSICDQNLYHFFNRISKEHFTGTRKTFSIAHNLSIRGIGMLVRRERKSYKKWIIK